ncbi:MAG: hypothetical protein D6808_00180 [Candidatus Dadabacteria bacterium]|nr:MAG: hypothetical protein D6808_00180 [Candidatus Dadabacteria bacterium]
MIEELVRRYPAYAALSVLMALALFGCSSSFPVRFPAGSNIPRPSEHPYSPVKMSNLPAERGESTQKGGPKRFPWERWGRHIDMNGSPIRNFYIKKGDDLIEEGLRKEALSFYLRAQKESISAAEREALIYRIASCYLVLDRPGKALVILTKYFKGRSQGVSSVGIRFSLLFAYAYGRKGDYDQSLAWFSRVYRLARGKGGFAAEAREGVSALLSSIPKDELDVVYESWRSEPFVGPIVARVRADRASGLRKSAYIFGGSRGDDYQQFEAKARSPTSGRGAQLGVLLPLSGRYSLLGSHTKNGIELAMMGYGSEYAPRFVDTQGNSLLAEEYYLDLANAGSRVVIGPLLSDSFEAITTHRGEVPLLSFSKKESKGGKYFSLGVSVHSQVESLVVSAYRSLGLTRYAIIYPDSRSGYEFAEEYKRILRRLGLTLSYEASYSHGRDEEFVPLAEELEQSNSQALFIPDLIGKAVLFLSNVSPSYRERLKILGPAVWDDRKKLSRVRTILEGAMFVTPFYKESNRELVRKFVSAYKNKFGFEPDFLAAQGFDGATMVAAALKRSEEESITFEDAFLAIRGYEGLTGLINVHPDGEVERFYSILEIKDGKIVEITPSAYLAKAHNSDL